MLSLERTDHSARLAFTDRAGGASRDPYGTLNLGGHVGDDADLVAANRSRLAEAVGLPVNGILYMNQVHGADVAVVDRPWDGPAPEVDAMVTDRRGLALAVLVADCAPILLADAEAGVVGVAHSGRPGLAAGVVPAVVKAMQRLGARAMTAWIGPAVCGSCYEVPADLQRAVGEIVPESVTTTRAGTPGLDIRAGARAQLAAAGVEHVEVSDVCTIENADYYSYRRDGRTGRFAGLAWLAA